jgi:hypothetical protein
MPTLERCFQR